MRKVTRTLFNDEDDDDMVNSDASELVAAASSQAAVLNKLTLLCVSPRRELTARAAWIMSTI